MYSTCLFCHQDLGKNEVVEHFPIGRRLAFDAAKGRLWVVCRKCERWNLTPLEERWEAIEECERAFRSTKLRVSTDHIGLARLREGLELVRIGEPHRPEMAAWRYGDQFGRRRRKRITLIAGAGAALGVMYVAGPMLGSFGVVSFNGLYHAINAGNALYRSRTLIQVPFGKETRRVRLSQLNDVELVVNDPDPILRLSVLPPHEDEPWWRYRKMSESIELTGEDAVRGAGAILARLNGSGGSAKTVARAVTYLEEAADTVTLFRTAARDIEEKGKMRDFMRREDHALRHLPAAGRLALEMAAHEDSERRALEGELHILAAAWKDAEEIAGIADDMFLPESVADNLARLKRQRDQ